MSCKKYVKEATKRGYVRLADGPYNCTHTGIINIVWFIPHKKNEPGDYSKYHASWINDEVMVGYIELEKPGLVSPGCSGDLSYSCIVAPYISPCKDLTQSHEEWIDEVKNLINSC